MKIIGIIRSIGERTESFSKYLLQKQISDIYLVKDIIPIKNMSISCIKIGLQSQADYMVTCDADVFVLPNAVNDMLKEAQKKNSVLLTGHTKSKFFGKGQGGIRIWDCVALRKALHVLETDIETNLQRPEELIHIRLGGALSQQVTSLHEYDQYYFHIYEKFVNKSIKSKSIRKRVLKFKEAKDVDFRVAYCGFFDKEKNYKKSFPNLTEKTEINNMEMEKRYKGNI